MMRTATDYRFRVRVRNDGAATWATGPTVIACRLFKVSSSPDSEEEVQITPIRVAWRRTQLRRGGRRSDDVNMKDHQAAIPVWKQSIVVVSTQVRGFGRLRWGGISNPSQHGTRIVDVFDSDYGAKIIGLTCRPFWMPARRLRSSSS